MGCEGCKTAEDRARRYQEYYGVLKKGLAKGDFEVGTTVSELLDKYGIETPEDRGIFEQAFYEFISRNKVY